ncbi:MAG: hypothetical protein ACNYVW_05045 [Methanosarcinales archaeon]
MNRINEGYFPYLRIGKMNELVRAIPLPYVSDVDEFSTQSLATAIGASTTTINNLIATLKSLNLVVGKRSYKFTGMGKDYITLLRTQEEKAKKVLRDQVKDIDYFMMIEQKLQQEGKLTIFVIGNQIVTQYNKSWKNPLTLKTYGAAIASILDFTGLGHYKKGLLKSNQLEEAEGDIPIPYLSAEKMFKILEALFSSNGDIHALSRELGTKERRLSQELSCCGAFGFVLHPHRGFYELTKEGKAMARYSDKLRKMQFTEYLVNSNYKRVIDKLPEAKITVETVGNVLESVYEKEWTAVTKKTYAKKFLNWLRFSGLVVKGAKGYNLKGR